MKIGLKNTVKLITQETLEESRHLKSEREETNKRLAELLEKIIKLESSNVPGSSTSSNSNIHSGNLEDVSSGQNDERNSNDSRQNFEEMASQSLQIIVEGRPDGQL